MSLITDTVRKASIIPFSIPNDKQAQFLLDLLGF